MSESELRAALDETHARAVRAARAARDTGDPARQLHWYAVFEESLRVAGLATALREADRAQTALENAAVAAAATFALQGSFASPREDVETDASMANAWVWVHGVLAALAAGRRDAQADLLDVDEGRLTSEQVIVSPGLSAFAAGLRAALAGAPDRARTALAAVGDDEPYYAAQARALLAILAAEPPDLDSVAAATEAAYAAPELQHEPERYLRLPVLALRALAES
jgi:hypothetical protein